MFRSLCFHAPKALATPVVTQALQSLRGWRVDGNHHNVIERNYTFDNFLKAMDFMTAVAPECEKMQHHPEWTNVYNRITVRLSTHDAGNKITQNDIDLAAAMNRVYDQHTAKK